MRKLAASSHRTMPWKNGGGTTTEIARFPAEATLDDFEWRVSMARVEGSGPFSFFPGIDRTLVLIEGGGLALVIDGGAPVILARDAAPFSFSGEATVASTLSQGAIEDLNVMTRRGRFAHVARRETLAAMTSIEPKGELTVLVVLEGVAHAHQAGESLALVKRDALLVENREAIILTPEPSVEVVVVTLSRV